MDDWSHCAPRLMRVSDLLNDGNAEGAKPFDEAECMAPLPRAHQWADGSAYVTHVELVRRARGAEMPPSFWTDPLMYQGGSDGFIGPRDPVLAATKPGASISKAKWPSSPTMCRWAWMREPPRSTWLLMLVNDVSLRNLIPAELAKNFGFFQSKPATAFSPVAVTPDELGPPGRTARCICRCK